MELRAEHLAVATSTGCSSSGGCAGHRDASIPAASLHSAREVKARSVGMDEAVDEPAVLHEWNTELTAKQEIERARR
jgi:hypothetical protein